MKFLFLLWIAIGRIFDASIWATAAWCVLYSFSDISWLQCFWISLAIHFVGSLWFVKYIRISTREDCFSYIRRESRLFGLFIISAPVLSILPTVVAIVLLSVLQTWTNLESIGCTPGFWSLVWSTISSGVREARRMALQANESAIAETWKASGK